MTAFDFDDEAMLRTVRLRPYAKGKGPTFGLMMRDSGKRDGRGQTRIEYALSIRESGKGRVLFHGSDFCGSPMHADDSDATVASLLVFLTLRPGDTDAEYFAEYTPEQREFCEQHAEALALEALNRFGEV